MISRIRCTVQTQRVVVPVYFSGSSNGNRVTAPANSSLSFCTRSTSSRLCEDTWKLWGPGARYGVLLGTIQQIDATDGFCGNSSSSTSPNNRDNGSGTKFDFSATCLAVKSKCCKAIAQRVGIFDVLHVV